MNTNTNLYKHKFLPEEIFLVWDGHNEDFRSKEGINLKIESYGKISIDRDFRMGTPEVVPVGGLLWFPRSSDVSFEGDVFVYEDITCKPVNYSQLVRLYNDKGPRILFVKEDELYIYKGAFKAVEVVNKDGRVCIRWRKCFAHEYNEDLLSKKLGKYIEVINQQNK